MPDQEPQQLGLIPTDTASAPAKAAVDIKPPNLFVIPAGTPASQCFRCKATIYRVQGPHGMQPLRAELTCHYRKKQVIIQTPDCHPPSPKGAPHRYDGVGFNHFIDCQFADAFRRRN